MSLRYSFSAVHRAGGGGALSDDDLAATVKQQLGEWWGEQVDSWTLLRIYRFELCVCGLEYESTRHDATSGNDSHISYETFFLFQVVNNIISTSCLQFFSSQSIFAYKSSA